VFNQKKNKYITNDTNLIKVQFPPNNTFYLLASLIGLESGAIKDTNQFFEWDQKAYPNLNWNQDQNLYMAFKFQTDWYFNQVAKNIDSLKMQSWLKLIGYGNNSIADGIKNQFWNNKSLEISVFQQMDFFRKFYYYNLPFSPQNIKFTRKFFTSSKLANKNLYAFKTKGTHKDKPMIWYMGYVEFLNNTYLIVHCVEMNSRKKNKYFSTIQSELLFATLKELGVMDDGMCGKM
jgi:beta-lactamase class D